MKYVLKVISEKCIWLILILALGIVGCAPTTTSYSSKLRLTPLSNQDTVSLTANDIVRMMRQVGFSDKQILKLGTKMYNGLSHSGATQLKINDKVEAIFAVNNDFVYIATRLRGSFIYNVKTGRILSSTQL